ncbi:putative hydrolase [Arabidopsis thaliana]
MTSYYVEEEETNLEMCLNDNYEECHGSKSPLTRDISFLGKENYVKQGEVLEHEEKLDNHTLLYRGPKASRQAKPRHKFFHTNPRVVQEVLQEVTQRTSMWGGPEKRQAVALRISADATVVYRCRINAYQDTLCCSVS